MEGIQVVPYSDAALISLLEKYSRATRYAIEVKNHVPALRGYFHAIGARTIVAEEEYVDRDYLEDYAAYYVRGFTGYSRYCTRLHFFKSTFDASAFKELLSNGVSSVLATQLTDSYLGFVVVKPLPATILGRTCLTTYPHSNSRYFPIVREYRVNLCGLPLSVSSIAFQEQDSTVSACASSAIWSGFQQTGSLFHHNIPSPVEITKAAIKYFPYANRHFPNKGLTPEQMAHAVRNVGLEPYLVKPENFEFLRGVIYAYLSARIPLIMGFKIADGYREIGLHAATVTGYNIDKRKALRLDPETGLLLTSSPMDKLYVHDDQVGPFSRMEFTMNRLGLPCLSTSWGQAGGGVKYHAEPHMLLIPLHNKVRIPYGIILQMVVQLDQFFRVADKGFMGVIGPIEWDVQLGYSNELKRNLMADSRVDSAVRLRTVQVKMPKYVWKVKATSKSHGEILLIFDATDLEQGDLLCCSIPLSNSLNNLILTILTDSMLERIHNPIIRRNLEHLKRNLIK